MDQFRSFVYFNGSKRIGAGGLSFEGEKRAMYIVRGMSVQNLYEKICRKLNLQQNQVISLVTGRVPCGTRKYAGLEICDDEDVDIFLTTFIENSSSQFVELYVDIEISEDITIPIRGLDLNSQSHHVSSSAPHFIQSSVAVGESSQYMVDVGADNEEEEEGEEEDNEADNEQNHDEYEAHNEENHDEDEIDNEEDNEEDEDTLLANDDDQNDTDVGDELHGNIMSQEIGIPMSSAAVVPPPTGVVVLCYIIVIILYLP